jgi:hypothetical protein
VNKKKLTRLLLSVLMHNISFSSRPYVHINGSVFYKSVTIQSWLIDKRVGQVILELLTAWLQTMSRASRCFFKQETLLSLLSTGWIQEGTRDCFNKLLDSDSIELK